MRKGFLTAMLLVAMVGGRGICQAPAEQSPLYTTPSLVIPTRGEILPGTLVETPQEHCLPCCPERCLPRVWFGTEYLMWWLKDQRVPPLVTTGSPTDNVPGAIGQPGTRTLFGDAPIDYSSFSGIRVMCPLPNLCHFFLINR